MADSDTTEFETSRFRRSATERIANRDFPLAVRGYDRGAVDAFVQEVLEVVSELEGRQTRETVVQRALDEIGEETAGILQRAHETADEIAARSRAQAEGRIQRAEREADMLRQQADAYSEQLIVDTRILWEERQRLIQDIRQLADEVLATAEDASERVDSAGDDQRRAGHRGGGPAHQRGRPRRDPRRRRRHRRAGAGQSLTG